MYHSVQYVIIIIRDYSSIPLFYNGCFTTQWIKGAYEVHESARSKDKTKTLPSTHFLWKRIIMSFIWIFKEDLFVSFLVSYHQWVSMFTFSSSYNILTRCVGLSVVGPYRLVFSTDSACLGSPEKIFRRLKWNII